MPEARIRPFLMFQGDGAAALDFYLATLPDAMALSVSKHPAGAPNEGQIAMAILSIAGQEVMLNDSPPVHDFTFTPSTSFFLDCADEAEQERLFAALSEGGKVMMPLGDYGFSRKFGWVSDRFGVSWQLNLA